MTDVASRGTRRAGRRKLDVLAAACRVIAERGADATRFQDVAEASGVPVSTLQYYFGSREDLLVAAFEHASRNELAALAEAIAGMADPWAKLRHLVRVALAGYGPEPDASGRLWIEAWRFGLRDAEVRADVHRDYAAWRRLIADIVRDGISSGRFTTAQRPERVAVLTLALLDGLGVPLVVGDPQVSATTARQTALDTLTTLLGVM